MESSCNGKQHGKEREFLCDKRQTLSRSCRRLHLTVTRKAAPGDCGACSVTVEAGDVPCLIPAQSWGNRSATRAWPTVKVHPLQRSFSSTPRSARICTGVYRANRCERNPDPKGASRVLARGQPVRARLQQNRRGGARAPPKESADHAVVITEGNQGRRNEPGARWVTR